MGGMSGETGEWQRVGEMTSARFAEMRTTLSALQRLSGVSDTTWRKILNGTPVPRADRRAKVAAALGWTADSIDRILAGGDPVVDDDPPAPDWNQDRVKFIGMLEQRIAVAEEAITRLAELVEAGLAELEARRDFATKIGMDAAAEEVQTRAALSALTAAVEQLAERVARMEHGNH